MGWILYFMALQVCVLLVRWRNSTSAPAVFLISSSVLLHLFLRVNRKRVTPLRWPVVGTLPGVLANAHRLHDFFTGLLRESGYTFALTGPWLMGLDFVLTCDPANAKHLYNANFSNYPKGREFSDIFHDIFGRGILAVDGDLWSKQRRMANAHMSAHSFRSAVAGYTREKVESSVLPLLARTAALDRAFDLQEFFKRFALDVVCNLIAGSDPGCLADVGGPSVPFVEAVNHMEEVLLYRHLVPKMWWKLLRWLKMGEEKKMIMARKGLDQFIARCIEERRREGGGGKKEAKDLLTSYMHQRSLERDDDRDDHYDYFGTDEFLRDTLATFLAAGTNTQATALSWFFWQLSKSPDVEKKILEELREARSKLDKGDDDGVLVVFDVAVTEGLVYLHAALCETLRLFPSVPFNHKMAAEEDVLPSGHRVRAGAMVIYSLYSTARMERFWGEDCLEFRPERWIDTSKGQLKYQNPKDFLAFHYGPRTCVGKNMALTQMKLLAAAMVYNFHVDVVEGCQVEPRMAMILQMKNGLQVKVRKRKRLVT